MRKRSWGYVFGLIALLLAALVAVPVSGAQAAPAGSKASAAESKATVDGGMQTAVTGRCSVYWPGSQWPPPTVRRGSVDTSIPSAVMLAQCYLNFSVLSSFLEVDGRFGQLTDAMVRTFQSPNCANVPPVDGIVGRNTWNSLNFWANSSGWAC